MTLGDWAVFHVSGMALDGVGAAVEQHRGHAARVARAAQTVAYLLSRRTPLSDAVIDFALTLTSADAFHLNFVSDDEAVGVGSLGGGTNTATGHTSQAANVPSGAAAGGGGGVAFDTNAESHVASPTSAVHRDSLLHIAVMRDQTAIAARLLSLSDRGGATASSYLSQKAQSAVGFAGNNRRCSSQHVELDTNKTFQLTTSVNAAGLTPCAYASSPAMVALLARAGLFRLDARNALPSTASNAAATGPLASAALPIAAPGAGRQRRAAALRGFGGGSVTIEIVPCGLLAMLDSGYSESSGNALFETYCLPPALLLQQQQQQRNSNASPGEQQRLSVVGAGPPAVVRGRIMSTVFFPDIDRAPGGIRRLADTDTWIGDTSVESSDEDSSDDAKLESEDGNEGGIPARALRHYHASVGALFGTGLHPAAQHAAICDVAAGLTRHGFAVRVERVHLRDGVVSRAAAAASAAAAAVAAASAGLVKAPDASAAHDIAGHGCVSAMTFPVILAALPFCAIARAAGFLRAAAGTKGPHHTDEIDAARISESAQWALVEAAVRSAVSEAMASAGVIVGLQYRAGPSSTTRRMA